ncbi:MAG: metal ABC transporter substrate-binding protein [Deltaproteobacteria bacterium]
MHIKQILLLALVGYSSAFANLRVVTTTEDLRSITEYIGGDLISVSSIAKGTQDPHFVEAKPSYLVAVSRADLLIAIGLELESGWLPLLIRGARQPKLMPGEPGCLTVSEAITPMDIRTQADRSQGDVHPLGNPHFMADPDRVLAVAELINKRLGELDPTHAKQFSENLAEFKTALSNKITKWKKKLAPYSGTKVVGYHMTFNYLFKYFGFELIGFLEPKPGIQPTAQHILKLIEIVKAQKAKLIVVESFFDPKPGETLAEKTQAKLVLIPAYVGGDDKSKTYFDWMDTLVNDLEKGLK